MVPPALTRLAKTVHAFAVETRGVFLPIAGFMLLILIVVAGAGTDFGRAILIRARVAAAVDAAVLAVARDLSVKIMTDAEISDVLNKSFQSNLTSLNLEGVSMGNLVYTIDPVEGTVEATATANVPTTFIFMGGIGPKTIPVSVTAQSTYSLFDVELAMVLDITGSMNTNNNIASLRTAATSVVDILIPPETSESDSRVKISLVPYSQGVNLGTYAPLVKNGNSPYTPCVTERMGPQKFTDATYNFNGQSSNFFGGGTTKCPSQSPLRPLSANAPALKTAINGLVAMGGTAGQIGIAWGWYTLSPNWSNLWPSASDPESYGKDKLKKVALIMTDGDFNDFYDLVAMNRNTCNFRGQRSDSTEAGWNFHDSRNGFYWLPDRWLGGGCLNGTNSYWQGQYFHDAGYNDQPSVRARRLCDAMKEKDIHIYTVLFAGSNGPSSNAETLMQYCATDPNTSYFKATNSQALISAFQKIANQIQSIYLSK
ncbi:pilus assembly protein TadG [Microvirga tunisiensis]|uniref:Pilus assembly protein TadG n=1 Tax=Pannonibacter tanglangensis TaxID=2750084 RepID=A0A7X5F629_9HYPH|nr:pilus assembly protein TadG-related protein [Pannonibacter sp. XCT-53]NBN80194.1 pilus assembly protein TadG [Pannonibacter sp. XCT-53]